MAQQQEEGVKLRNSSSKDSLKVGTFSDLNRTVREVVKNSTFWEQYGVDLCILASAFCLLPVGFFLVRCRGVIFVAGLLVLGTVHEMFITKGAHSAAHNALGPWKYWNKFWGIFFSEMCGAFTYTGGVQAHVNIHHPHTNIIGLGDSSIWKAPFLSRNLYLFIVPLFIPLFAPIYSAKMLWGKWKSVAVNLLVIFTGYFGHYMCFRFLSGLTPLWSVFCLLVTRGLYYCSYIHVNVFQHIGLAMYSQKNRPKRLRLMATGSLNLARNILFDYCMGHSLFNCHVEHHLFPNLSDNMCMKIKPLVKNYLKQCQLPYQEDTYWNRLKLFHKDYKKLMVDAPPITDFIGIQ
eukprot:gene5659-6355_t